MPVDRPGDGRPPPSAPWPTVPAKMRMTGASSSAALSTQVRTRASCSSRSGPGGTQKLLPTDVPETSRPSAEGVLLEPVQVGRVDVGREVVGGQLDGVEAHVGGEVDEAEEVHLRRPCPSRNRGRNRPRC